MPALESDPEDEGELAYVSRESFDEDNKLSPGLLDRFPTTPCTTSPPVLMPLRSHANGLQPRMHHALAASASMMTLRRVDVSLHH